MTLINSITLLFTIFCSMIFTKPSVTKKWDVTSPQNMVRMENTFLLSLVLILVFENRYFLSHGSLRRPVLKLKCRHERQLKCCSRQYVVLDNIGDTTVIEKKRRLVKLTQLEEFTFMMLQIFSLNCLLRKALINIPRPLYYNPRQGREILWIRTILKIQAKQIKFLDPLSPSIRNFKPFISCLAVWAYN